MLAGGVIVAALLVFSLHACGPSARWFPGCMFHRLTGMYCPGCGMTRATYAALHGHFATAFRFNPVGMVLFPIAMLGVMLEWIAWVRGKPLPFTFRAGGLWAWGLVVVILSFWVLRNIPVWPCNLLAPP